MFVDIISSIYKPIRKTMQKNSPQGFSKTIVSMVFTLTLFVSCSKSYDPANLTNDKVALLTGQPDSVSWVLNTIQVNNTSDTAAKGAVKIYHADGSFTDNLGFTGFWTMYSRDSLIESSHPCVNPDAPYTTQNFHIDRLDKGRLQLTYTNADKKIKLLYDANK
jgi:hypothetical protein